MQATSASIDTGDEQPLEAVARRRPDRWAAATVLLGIVAFTAYSLVTNPRMQWGVVGEYLFSHVVLTGLLRTLELTVIAMVVGIALGVVLAVMAQSPNKILSWLAQGYIWIFRGTPQLVQLLFWYNLAAVYPVVSFGIPFGPEFVRGDANDYITPLVAAILGLGLNEAGYMCEIVRGGIISVDEGQVEAAYSLGYSRGKAMRRIVLPQALRVIIPPTGNETISTLKATSLVSVISMTELLFSVQLIYSKTFQPIPLLIVACIWYLAVTSVMTFGQHFLEKSLTRDSDGSDPITLLVRMRRNVGFRRAPGVRSEVTQS